MAIQSRYVSTSKAAGILGVSTTQVKMLVDGHKLQAWKTQGGHRRIALDSIESYIASFHCSAKAADAKLVRPHQAHASQIQTPVTPRISVCVQTPELLDAIRGFTDRVVSSADLSLPRLLDSPAQALRELSNEQPTVLVLEMAGSLAQQEKTLSPLARLDASGPPVSVLVVTRHSGLKLPTLAGGRCLIHVFSAPVSLEWAQGCLAGMLTLLTSLQWGAPCADLGDHASATMQARMRA
jgi:excisionase family DNA binding protein